MFASYSPFGARYGSGLPRHFTSARAVSRIIRDDRRRQEATLLRTSRPAENMLHLPADGARSHQHNKNQRRSEGLQGARSSGVARCIQCNLRGEQE